MDWINIRTRMLRAPEYIGSTPTERATWLNVLCYCAEQENGGRIAGCSGWKDRQWQQTCGVTLREVRAASKLLVVEGDDVLVWAYPSEKEMLVAAKREAGRRGGQCRSEAKARAVAANGELGGRPENPSKNPSKNLSKNLSTNLSSETKAGLSKNLTEGEGEEEMEGEGEAGPAPAKAPERAAEAAIPTVQEVVAYGQRCTVPEDYCRRFHAKHSEEHRWLVAHGRLIDWRQRLVRFWAEDRPSWGLRPKAANGVAAPGSVNPETGLPKGFKLV